MKPALFSALLVFCLGLPSCSLQNREGPNLICKGSANAPGKVCEHGIIGSCVAGQTVYEVCDDKDACSATWQTPGSFTCDQSSGSAGHGGNKIDGSGGSSGGEAQGGAAGAGGQISPCGPADVCPIASTGGVAINAFTTDGTNAYFTDGQTLWSVPREGGFPTVLASSAKGGESHGSLRADASYVYVLQSGDSTSAILRVPKAGGSFETVVSTNHCWAFVLGEDRIFWTEGASLSPLHATLKTGGEDVVIIDNTDVRDLTVGAGYIWMSSGKTLARLPTTTATKTSPSVIDVSGAIGNGHSVQSFAVDASGLYFTVSGDPFSIWSLPAASAQAIRLLDGENKNGTYQIGLSDSSLFWEGWDSGRVVRKLAKSGGQPSTIYKGAGNFGRFVADDQYAYWADGSSLIRAPK